ncbi:FecR family protein [Flavihumibacter sp. ZG627]|uniref:FecR family protein n=1 Tax=Flavihumibacter sp. ZG627 TaxID=1463156 RepID=UPI000693C92C|nr:FecR family protein [Flavihumibacter sp. ZG627]
MKQNPYSDMDQPAYRIAYLIAGFIRNTITEKEHDELDDWVNESDDNMRLFEELTDEQNLEANLAWMDKVQTEQSYKALQEKGAFDIPRKKFQLSPVWMVAASVILIVGVFIIYRFAGNSSTSDNNIAVSDTTQLKPGGNRATLTLSDGSVIDLTTANNGIIEIGKGSHVNKPAAGELVYDAGVSTDETPSIHTLSTPVGGQYHVTLPDGTKVWLNAATKLMYPSRFASNERKVEIDGEAYFEVVKNDQQPFRVVLQDGSTVTVLGTHFNVMSYTNETEKEITLLEGKVAVEKNNSVENLEPGTQAIVKTDAITKRTGIDTEEITAWKNGLFVFHDATIESIMKQVERWYDAKVVYKGDVKQLFNASILRSEPLSKLLRLLELNGYVHFKIENKTIYVLP